MGSTLPHDRNPADAHELLLRETNHRCSNDLQMVVSLLALQSRRATNSDVRQALCDAMRRVSVLAKARSARHDMQHRTLEAALRQVCEALQAQAELRSIQVSFEVTYEENGLSATEITVVALVVNELATNAIRHAFEEGQPGCVTVIARRNDKQDVCVTVSDDGVPFPEIAASGDCLGLGLVRRLADSIGGLLVAPSKGSKVFELRLPAERDPIRRAPPALR